MASFKFISVPHILLLGTSYSTAHAFHCIHHAYRNGSNVKVMHFSLNGHPFNPEMHDYRATVSHPVRNSVVISKQFSQVYSLSNDRVRKEMASSDVIHLNVPLMDTIWDYVELVLHHAKSGSIVVTPLTCPL
jgi:hypothetical protein